MNGTAGAGPPVPGWIRVNLPLARGVGVFGPLAERSLRLLWLAATTSAVGSAFVTAALASAVLNVGGNPTSLGMVPLVGALTGAASSGSLVAAAGRRLSLRGGCRVVRGAAPHSCWCGRGLGRGGVMKMYRWS